MTSRYDTIRWYLGALKFPQIQQLVLMAEVRRG